MRPFTIGFLVLLLHTRPTVNAQADSSLQKELINAQIKNQNAQAAYYQQQTKPGSGTVISPALAGAIASLFGALLAFGGVYFSNMRQWKLEKGRWDRAREDDRIKWMRTKEDERNNEIRKAAADLGKLIAAGNQAIVWLTYIAFRTPGAFTLKDIEDYDTEMKAFFVESIKAQAYLISLDKEVHQRMRDAVKNIFAMDDDLQEFTNQFKSSKDPIRIEEAVKEIGKIYLAAYSMYENMPLWLGNIFELAATR